MGFTIHIISVVYFEGMLHINIGSVNLRVYLR